MRRNAAGRWFAGTGPYVVGAAVLAALGVLSLLLLLQDPSRVLWTGVRVPAQSQGGIVFYRYGGESYSLDAPGPAPADRTKVTPATVYLDPANPSAAVLDQGAARWVEALPAYFFLGAALLVAGGVLRGARLRRRRRAALALRPEERFGQGLDPEFVQRRLDRLREGPATRAARASLPRQHRRPDA